MSKSDNLKDNYDPRSLTVHVDIAGGVREVEGDVFAWNVFLRVDFQSGESLEGEGRVTAGAALV